MPINSNIGAVVPETNGTNRRGSDNPGQTTCTNCRKVVQPRPIINSNRPDQKVMINPTSAGYHCPSCGHNLNWVKSTGKPAGPVQSGQTNLNTAADM